MSASPAGSRPGVATREELLERDEAPDPLTHAAPDAELADAQLALGRTELAREADYDEEEPSELDEELEDDDEPETAGAGSGGRGASPAVRAGGAGAGAVERRESLLVRLVQFLQGSWRELHRVQWPDRQQVMQATGVVIGFVIVAGLFLGLADLVATKLVNLILQ